MTPSADQMLTALHRAERDHERRFPDAPPPTLGFRLDPKDARVVTRALREAIRAGHPLPCEVAWAATSNGRFERALDDYSRRFRREGLPFLRCCGDAESRDVGAKLLRQAVRTGAPLHDWAVCAALGLEKPPPGACW